MILLYVINYFIGIWRNKRYANKWLDTAKPLLQKHFPINPDQWFEELTKTSIWEFDFLCPQNKFSHYCIINLQLRKWHELFALFLKNLCVGEQDLFVIELPLKITAKEFPLEFLISSLKNSKKCFKAMPHLEDQLKFQKGQTSLNKIWIEHSEIVDKLIGWFSEIKNILED